MRGDQLSLKTKSDRNHCARTLASLLDLRPKSKIARPTEIENLRGQNKNPKCTPSLGTVGASGFQIRNPVG